jgi:hypothetical protein
MELNFLPLGSEATTSLRQAQSSNSSEAQTRPELVDFAGILGGFFSAAPAPLWALSEADGQAVPAEAMVAPAPKGGGQDTSESSSHSNIDPSVLPSTAGLGPKTLNHLLLGTERFSSPSSAQLNAVTLDSAAGGRQATTDQPQLAKRDHHRAEAAATILASGDTNPLSGRIEVAADGSSGSLQYLSHDAREKREGDALVMRMSVAGGSAVQEPITPDGTLSNVPISTVTPTVPVPFSARSRLTLWTDSPLEVEADTRSQATSHEPVPISSIGELIGVAGKLQFNKQSLSLPLTSGSDPQPVAIQGGQFQIPFHQEPSLPQPQVITTPLGAQHWPNVFSASIVRLATEQITQANLTVTPDNLGTISIRIALEGSHVSLGFIAENSDVCQAVNASLPLLQDMLEKSGLSLGQSSVGQEAPRDANPNTVGQVKNLRPESEAIAVAPVIPARSPRTELRTGRVDFFA